MLLGPVYAGSFRMHPEISGRRVVLILLVNTTTNTALSQPVLWLKPPLLLVVFA